MRFNPLKKITIQRPVLTAVTVVVISTQDTVSSQPDRMIHDIFYWTERMTVLVYI